MSPDFFVTYVPDCSLIPPPRRHRRPAPNAPLRAALAARAGLPLAGPPAGGADTPPATAREATDAKPPPDTRYLWAMLLARIYEVFPAAAALHSGGDATDRLRHP